jgi:hypothetical protein
MATAGVGLGQVAYRFSGGAASFAACVGLGLATAAGLYFLYMQKEISTNAYYDRLLQERGTGGGGEGGGEGEGQPTDDWTCEDGYWCFSFDAAATWACSWIWTCRQG